MIPNLRKLPTFQNVWILSEEIPQNMTLWINSEMQNVFLIVTIIKKLSQTKLDIFEDNNGENKTQKTNFASENQKL